ncbi:hypothetical protein P775_27330 [Puniceibacterium antarcticum]|uniref:Uncharacterized protein n=1 Tax=Puniceibacterium antarcticum TaxID=1206336 RepID=A0A2G8QXN8_9RHOB|nr:hypothetical protein P775_27330 [Puniceibacterium antarcticum]
MEPVWIAYGFDMAAAGGRVAADCQGGASPLAQAVRSPLAEVVPGVMLARI